MKRVLFKIYKRLQLRCTEEEVLICQRLPIYLEEVL